MKNWEESFRRAQLLDRERARRAVATKKLRPAVWAKTEGNCWYCGWPMADMSEMTVDHVVPFVEGGSDEISNLVPACKKCNSGKGHRSLKLFRRPKSGIPYFSPEQEAYLASLGVTIPEGDYRFYFEVLEFVVER